MISTIMPSLLSTASAQSAHGTVNEMYCMGRVLSDWFCQSLVVSEMAQGVCVCHTLINSLTLTAGTHGTPSCNHLLAVLRLEHTTSETVLDREPTRTPLSAEWCNESHSAASSPGINRAETLLSKGCGCHDVIITAWQASFCFYPQADHCASYCPASRPHRQHGPHAAS